jgi:hypothetical protein
MRFFSILLLTAAVSGCANDGHRNGSHLSFNCSGADKGWDDCSKQADVQCGANGYSIIARNIDSVSTASGSSEMKRELVVTCK